MEPALAPAALPGEERAEADRQPVEAACAHQGIDLAGALHREVELAMREQSAGILAKGDPAADRLGGIVLEQQPHAGRPAPGEARREGARHDHVAAEVGHAENAGVAGEVAVHGLSSGLAERSRRAVGPRLRAGGVTPRSLGSSCGPLVWRSGHPTRLPSPLCGLPDSHFARGPGDDRRAPSPRGRGEGSGDLVVAGARREPRVRGRFRTRLLRPSPLTATPASPPFPARTTRSVRASPRARGAGDVASVETRCVNIAVRRGGRRAVRAPDP